MSTPALPTPGADREEPEQAFEDDIPTTQDPDPVPLEDDSAGQAGRPAP